MSHDPHHEDFAIAIGALREALWRVSPYDVEAHVRAARQFCDTCQHLGQPIEVVRAVVAIAAGAAVPTPKVRESMLGAVNECFPADS
jgi:hypothetical protein